MRKRRKQNLINLCPQNKGRCFICNLKLHPRLNRWEKFASKTQLIRKIKLFKNIDYILIFTFFSPNLIQIFHKNHWWWNISKKIIITFNVYNRSYRMCNVYSQGHFFYTFLFSNAAGQRLTDRWCLYLH